MGQHSERRRSPRVELIGRLRGEVVTLDVPIRVREISLGGMSFESPEAFDVGAIREFRLTLGDGALVEVRGRIIYSRSAAETGASGCVSGVQFVDDTGPLEPPDVGSLLNKVQ